MRACIGTVARAPSSAAAAAAAIAAREVSAVLDARAQRRDGGPERVDHRLVAGLGRAELDHAGERRVERVGERRPVERRRVADRAAGAAQGGAPQRPARAADRRDQRLAGDDQLLAGRLGAVLRAQRLDHRAEAARHVDAVVAVADRRVELREVGRLRLDGGGHLLHPAR